LARQLDPATRDALLARVRFYRDLGLTEFYRRPVGPALLAQLAAEPEAQPALPVPSQDQNPVGSGVASEIWETIRQPTDSQEAQPIPLRKPFNAAPRIAAIVAPADRAAGLQLIRDEIGDCTRCALHKGRNKLVFGDGSPSARLMFVGEGPGADEDAQGNF